MSGFIAKQVLHIDSTASKTPSLTHQKLYWQSLWKKSVKGTKNVILRRAKAQRCYEKKSCMWCFTNVINKIYDFDEVLPTSVSLPAWALQKIALKLSPAHLAWIIWKVFCCQDFDVVKSQILHLIKQYITNNMVGIDCGVLSVVLALLRK